MKLTNDSERGLIVFKHALDHEGECETIGEVIDAREVPPDITIDIPNDTTDCIYSLRLR